MQRSTLASHRFALIDLETSGISPAVDRITEIGMTTVGNSSEEFARDIKAESERWAKIIKERNLQVK